MMEKMKEQNPYRYTTQDKIADGVMLACIGAAIYGILLAVGF